MSATFGSRRADAAVAEDAAAATRALYERFGQRIFSFCVSRLRDVEEAQDATQTTFLHAMRSLDNGVEPRFELPWLLAIAHNVCRSTRRSLNRRHARVSYADVTELEAAAESMADETGEELAWIKDALERLPETQRRAVLLREWQGLSYADIAAELQLSHAAVETLLFRARRALAAQLARAKRGLKALDLSSLELLFRNVGAVKTGVIGLGLAVAVGPLPGAEVSREARPAAPAHASVAGNTRTHLRAASTSRSSGSRARVRPKSPRDSRISAAPVSRRQVRAEAPTQPAPPTPESGPASRSPAEPAPAAPEASPPPVTQVVEDTIAHTAPATPLDLVEAAPPLPQLKLPNP